MEIVQVINPRALDSALMGDFLRRVFPPDSISLPGGFEASKDLLAARVGHPHWRMWVGIEDGQLAACSLVYGPPAQEQLLRPEILHFHNDGSAALRRAMTAEWVAFLRSNGHLKAWATNVSERPDSLWARDFRTAGEWRRVGSIMEVSLRE